MYHWWFLLRLNQKRVVKAIAAAEAHTSGEIRVFISHKHTTNPMAEAQAQFEQLGMAATRERNGVLFFIAPRSRNFAIIGDKGINERCGDAYWQSLVQAVSEAFKKHRHTKGIVHAIHTLGTLLAEHFPRLHDDSDELPNDIVMGK